MTDLDELPDPDECDHESTLTATEADNPPAGTVICTDCGIELESAE